jgi:hypothetical protein
MMIKMIRCGMNHCQSDISTFVGPVGEFVTGAFVGPYLRETHWCEQQASLYITIHASVTLVGVLVGGGVTGALVGA